MPAPDRQTTSSDSPAHATIPAPVSSDLATDSNDPQELRRLLDRARERLSFYESFDRTIGETLRRTGEMMEETVALREQAAQAAAAMEAARTAADDAMKRDRERYRSLIEEALGEVQTARPVIDRMIARLQEALGELGDEAGTTGSLDAKPDIVTEAEPEVPIETPGEVETPDATAEAPDVEVPVTEPEDDEEDLEAATAPEEDEPVSGDQPGIEPASSDDDGSEETVPERFEAAAPQVIDVVAHAVPSAAMAIGLQQMLRELDTVTRVDAREFADGELRLHVECSGSLPDAPLAEWLSRNSGSLVSHTGKAIELRFA